MTGLVGAILILAFLAFAAFMFLERLSALLALPLMAVCFVLIASIADLIQPPRLQELAIPPPGGQPVASRGSSGLVEAPPASANGRPISKRYGIAAAGAWNPISVWSMRCRRRPPGPKLNPTVSAGGIHWTP